jgi:hypothetical protein
VASASVPRNAFVVVYTLILLIQVAGRFEVVLGKCDRVDATYRALDDPELFSGNELAYTLQWHKGCSFDCFIRDRT